MSEKQVDFAVFGSSPLARLLAGLLAGTHGRSVAFIGESHSGYRLPRDIDLSIAPMTRPQSWSMVTALLPETLKLLSRIAGRSAWSRVDPILFAEEPEALEALSHMRHMASGFGLAAEKISASMVGAGRSGVMLRDAVRLNRPVLEPALDRWLDKQNVLRGAAEDVSIAADGVAILKMGDDTILAGQAILADSAAILAHLPNNQWPALLRRQTMATILTTPTQQIAAPVMMQVDTGTTLLQQAEGGIAAIGRGELTHFSAGLQTLLGYGRQVQQAGQTIHLALEATDGAPLFGRVGGVGADIVAGLGPTGGFLAPALARWIAGNPRAQEESWFGARLANRTASAEPVAEFHLPVHGQAA